MKFRITPSRLANILVATVLVAVPFHAFLTIWGASLVGHYTALRLWDDAILVVVMGIVALWLLRDGKLRAWFSSSLLVRLIVTYAALTLLLGFVSLVKGDVTPKALAYGVLVNLRFLAWFLAVLLVAQRSPWLRRVWPKLLLVPAAIVVVFATLQYTVLPHDFLTHFGYHAATNVAPIETINHNPNYIRVQATLRGANPLGAYLVIVLSALGVLYFRGKRKAVCAVFGVAALFALYASGSRSAWIGTVLSLGIIAWLQLPSRKARLYLGSVGIAVLLVAASGFYLLRDNTTVQNAIFHTQDNSKVSVSSNDAHESALRYGINDVVRQPLGDGPGTAGPASVYNTDHPVRIAENYYVQIAQEVGWLGLALLLAIFTLVAIELYGLVRTSRLALVMFTSFIGLAFVNLLSHAWVDDTLAFVWWGFAAIALAQPLPKVSRREAAK